MTDFAWEPWVLELFTAPYLIVFVAMFALDFVWAFYTRAITAGEMVKGAGYATVLVLLAGTAQIGYTRDPKLLIPAMFGAFGGTYLALRLTKGKAGS